ncbi:MAG TPA: hypothetical protein VFG81_02870 [Anaerolineales bacterium]|jgi:hypothetical protein|nr:hypothetical protein [Anaerolineales bacterium]
MIEIDFETFHNQDYEEAGYDLYVMKNGPGSVLYVGISRQSIWERWFGWNGHLLWADRVIEGNSPVGRKIVDHLPDSLKWKIQLWTLPDCIDFCSDILPAVHFPSIDFIEPYMIQKLSPILNGSYNLRPGKDTTPKSKKEIERENFLDDMYKKIFDK